jgi:Mrp family chromosome partitioning ATPase
VERLLRQLREQGAGALVVIDGPCVLGRGDALVFGRFVDRVLLVVRAGNTRSGDARRAAELIGGQRLLGVVYNVGPG